MTDNDKARESRLRRAAARQGFILSKSRVRDPNAESYGLYVLSQDSKGNRIHRFGGQAAVRSFSDGCGVNLDMIEHILNWRNPFVVPEDSEDPGAIDYPSDRAILDKYSEGWLLTYGGGSPSDWLLGGPRMTQEEALEEARKYLRGLRESF